MQLLRLKFIIYDLTPLKLCFKLIHPAGLRCNYHFHPRQSQRLSFPQRHYSEINGQCRRNNEVQNCHTRRPLHFLTTLNPFVCFHSSLSCALLSWRPSKHYSKWMCPCPSITAPFSVTTSLKRKQNHLFLETRTESHTAPTTMTPSAWACVPQAAILQEQR